MLQKMLLLSAFPFLFLLPLLIKTQRLRGYRVWEQDLTRLDLWGPISSRSGVGMRVWGGVTAL